MGTAFASLTSWMAAMPTPLAPAWISTLSPSCTLPGGGHKESGHPLGITFGLKQSARYWRTWLDFGQLDIIAFRKETNAEVAEVAVCWQDSILPASVEGLCLGPVHFWASVTKMIQWVQSQPFYTINRKHTWRMFILRNQALSNGEIPAMLGDIKDQSYPSFYHLLVALICVPLIATESEAPSSLPLIRRKQHFSKQVCREVMFGTFVPSCTF